MSEIRIRREHKLGLTKARRIAWKWAEEVERKFGMDCTVIEGESSDTVEFHRSGVNGELIVAPDHFDLVARLGFLLGAFRGTIEREIQAELDALLSKSGNAAPKKRAARAAGH
jgi:putative polyhydroxyalkanoate system protein